MLALGANAYVSENQGPKIKALGGGQGVVILPAG